VIDTVQLWCAVFGNDHPVEVEIGPGRGEMLLAYAAAAPGTNFFAIERAAGRAEHIMSKAAARGLDNVRVIVGDARCVIATLFPSASVAAYHVYFPDPWPKMRHRARRLFANADLARELARTLVPGGTVEIATDLSEVLEAACSCLTAAGHVRDPDAVARPGRPTTSFERRYAQAGTWYARFLRPQCPVG
jgi:tRNA (guanine-N7-)-methyltransferase